MESEEIFNKCNKLQKYAEWITEEEWSKKNAKEKYESERVFTEINLFFEADDIYISTSEKSSETTKNDAVQQVSEYVSKRNVRLANHDFNKIMEFTRHGVFRKGILLERIKSRQRPLGQPLEVSFHANMCDYSTKKAADVLRKPFDIIGKELSKDYGGNMEHLWIDLELVESYCENRSNYPFRFQRRVSGRGDTLTGMIHPDQFNVGHYSVKPDFDKLKKLSQENICLYVFELIYDSTKVLIENQKKLNDFDAHAFRANFLLECKKLGYLIGK